MTSSLGNSGDYYLAWREHLEEVRTAIRDNLIDAARTALAKAVDALWPRLPPDIVFLNPYINISAAFLPVSWVRGDEDTIYAAVPRDETFKRSVAKYFATDLPSLEAYQRNGGLTNWNRASGESRLFWVEGTTLVSRRLDMSSMGGERVPDEFQFYVDSLFLNELLPWHDARPSYIHLRHPKARSDERSFAAGVYIMRTSAVSDLPLEVHALLAELVALVLSESLHKLADRRRRNESIESEVRALIPLLDKAHDMASGLRSLVPLSPEEIYLKFRRARDLFPATNNPTEYYGRWTFRHKWYVNTVQENRDHFDAQVACILVAFADHAEERLPASISDFWPQAKPTPAQLLQKLQRRDNREICAVARLMELDSLAEPAGASDFFTFLRACLHEPFKAADSVLSGPLLALWGEFFELWGGAGPDIVKFGGGSKYKTAEVLSGLEAIRREIEESGARCNACAARGRDEVCVTLGPATLALAAKVDSLKEASIPLGDSGSLKKAIGVLLTNAFDVAVVREPQELPKLAITIPWD